MIPLLSIAYAMSNLKVTEAAIAEGVENLEPKNVADTYPPSVGKLYCFTRVVGATEETGIKHRWFYKDTLMAEVLLPVKSSSWRTYSNKNILPRWAGQWRVDISTEDGLLLKTLHFTIE